jgi:phosphatidylserine/phosphatidylglycerophosphate/cardiolipin synthase-like enzyme
MPDAPVSKQLRHDRGGFGVLLMPKGEAVKRPGSVGQIAPPAIVRIVGEDEQPLAPNEVGEVRLQLPGKQREYFNDPEATAETWRDGWLVTGDLGKLDDDGYLYIVGRSKDVIIRGGNNVHATDVEAVLFEHPAVMEAAVAGLPHEVLGEDVAACSTVYYWPKEQRGRDANGRLGILHVKCVVADGRLLCLSSANLTEYAFSINMELGVLITGGDLPERVERHFDRIIEDGRLLKL